MDVQGTMDSNDCKVRNDNVFEKRVTDPADLEEGEEILHNIEMKVTDATDSGDGRALKEQVTVLEMKTFKRYSLSLSQYDRLEEATEEDPLKILCVGGCTGSVLSKGIFIKGTVYFDRTGRISIRTDRIAPWDAIHSTKMPGNFGLKLEGSVRSNRKNFENIGPLLSVGPVRSKWTVPFDHSDPFSIPVSSSLRPGSKAFTGENNLLIIFLKV